MRPLHIWTLIFLASILGSCELLDPSPGPDAVELVEQSGPVDKNSEVSLTVGKDYYRRYCEACHGVSAEGTEIFSASIAGLSGIDGVVRSGPGAMPSFPYLTDASIESIELFLADQAPDLETGLEIYQYYCARCHGANAEGGEEFSSPIAGLTGIEDIVQNGRGDMPGFSNLSSEEIDLIEGFLGDQVPDLDTGLEIYQYYCARCHGANAEGGEEFSSPIAGLTGIEDIVQNGRGDMPGFSDLSSEEIDLIEGFLGDQVPDLDTGLEIYQYYCARCHGANAEGGEEFSSPIAGLTGIEDIVQNGRGDMPGFSNLSSEEIGLIQDFLADQVPDLTTGPEIFEYYCSRCHGADAQGGEEFSSSIGGLSGIDNVVQNGRGSMPGFPNLSQGDIDLIEDFLADQVPDLTTGPEIFEYYCSRCHGADAQGGEEFSSSIGGSSGIDNVVQNGRGSMPGFPNLSQGDIDLIEDFLADQVPDLTTGPEIFEYYCSRCHGADAQGGEEFYSSIGGLSGIDNVVQNGRGTMPGFPTLSAADIDLIEDFLADQVPDLTTGPEIFEYYCSRCHGADAQGGEEFSSSIGGLSGIDNIVQNGRGDMPAFPTLSTADIDLIEDFLADQVPDLNTGTEIFQYYCSRCHGADAQGGEEFYSSIGGLSGIDNVVQNGRGDMPAFPTLSTADIDLIEDFLADQVPDLTTGPEIFEYYCSRCHGADAQGGEEFYSSIGGLSGIDNVVQNGRGTMPGFPTLSAADIDLIEEFLADQVPDLTTGPEIFEYYCSRCHGADAQGGEEFYSSIGGLSGIDNVVQNGRGDMPGFPSLSASDIDLIEDFLADQVPDLTTGPEIFEYYCSRCHGADAQGGEEFYSSIGGLSGIDNVVQNGRGDMPAFPTLSTADIDLIEDFLADQVPDLTTGPEIFEYYCSRCHGADAQGGEEFYSSIGGLSGIDNVVQNGRGTMPGFPTLSAADIDLIEEFLADQVPDLTTGPEIFEYYCSRCHGADAQGGEEFYSSIGGLSGIDNVVQNGRGDMPGFPSLSASDIDLIEDFLADQVPDLTTGPEIFEYYCSRCHGADAQGGEEFYSSIGGLSGIDNVVQNGRGDMPAFPALSTADIDLIEDFLADQVPDLTTGPEIFEYYCSRCHGADAQGGEEFSSSIGGLSGIESIVQNGRGSMPGFPTLSAADIDLIEDFLADQVPDLDTGVAIYQYYCARCHGADAQGGDEFSSPIAGLSGIEDIVQNGRGDMPSFPTLSQGDIDMIEDFLADQIPDLNTGVEIYRYYCGRCHGPDAEGGDVFPNSIAGFATVRRTVERGLREMPAFPVLSRDDINLIEEFLLEQDLPELTTGQEFYEYYCARCHGLDAQGTEWGDEIGGKEYGDLKEKMREGPDEMPAYPEEMISNDNIRLLAEYLDTLED